MSEASASVVLNNFDPPAEVAMEAGKDPEAEYQRLLQRLCDASVSKRYEAFRDIPWEDPDYQVDPHDSRWELPRVHTLGGTAWYRSQPAKIRSRMGLHLAAAFTYKGCVFENILSQGLLRFAITQPHGSLEYRYAYHEIIEEGHHSLMFQELVNRSGLPVPLMSQEFFDSAQQVALYGSSFPEMLFIYALGGEDPIDYLQRQAIHNKLKQHPLAQRISQIHITEEARHVSFARAYLRRNVPKLGEEKKHELSLTAPTVLSGMAQMIMQPPEDVVARYQIPEEVVREAFVDSQTHRMQVVNAMGKLRSLCEELGLMNDEALAIWREGGLLVEGS